MSEILSLAKATSLAKLKTVRQSIDESDPRNWSNEKKGEGGVIQSLISSCLLRFLKLNVLDNT